MTIDSAGQGECHWVTTASPTIEAVVNPLAAACTERGYVPDVVRILQNPGVEDAATEALEIVRATVEAHVGSAPRVETVSIDSERDFTDIVEYHRHAIESGHSGDATVAVDVTPGRKFMSAIAFQAGIQFGADHVFYLYLDSSDYYDRVYPDLPRTGNELVDFSKVFDT